VSGFDPAIDELARSCERSASATHPRIRASGSVLKQKLMEHPKYRGVFPKSGLISPSSPPASIRYLMGKKR
jgi:hypothetical protein